MIISEQTKNEWRELGFYYCLDLIGKKWILVGSKKGLLWFVEFLRVYSKNKSYSRLSDHDHLGPYMYLKIVTWNKPIICSESIRGAQSDLFNLAGIIQGRLEAMSENDEVLISDEYCSEGEFSILLICKGETFDPSSLDK